MIQAAAIIMLTHNDNYINFSNTDTVNNILVSFSNSGRTWMVYMFNQCGFEYGKTMFGAERSKRLSFTDIHALYDTHFNEHTFKNKKIIFLHRDPRDVVVSSYLQTVNSYRFHQQYYGTLSEFIRDPSYGIEKIVKFNLFWRETLLCDKLLIQYENLKLDANKELKKIFDYCNVCIDPETIDHAVSDNVFDKMQQKELNRIRSAEIVPVRKITKSSLKMRCGEVGKYVDFLIDSDLQYCNDVLKPHDYFERMKL
jgi:hypothetical protein